MGDHREVVAAVALVSGMVIVGELVVIGLVLSAWTVGRTLADRLWKRRRTRR